MIHERFASLLVRRWHDQLRRQKAQAVRGADRLICNSESTRADVIEYYGVDPATVVAIPLACSDVFRVLGQEDDAGESDSLGEITSRPFLLWVGGRDAYKDFARFARAFSAWKSGAYLRVVTIGSPLTRTETELLSSLALTERVVSLTGVDDVALCRLYNRAAALVYPSVYEGFGIPLLEAMACGCPVVAARIPTSIEVAGDCAVLFEPANAEDLTSAIESAVADGRGSNRVRRGRQRVARFSWDKNAADTVRVYEQLSRKT
jgi:glycosyltransferase involved in cell wall biosynthesis